MRPLRRRVLVGIACSAAVVGLARYGGSPALTATHPDPLSSVGGVTVPQGLRCSEDSVIGYTGPRTLGCVHNESGRLEP